MAEGILNIIQRKNPDKDFDILKQIGSGTYGEVYKARVKASGAMVALKIIKLEPGEDFNIIQQEIAILADCKHPNIVGFHGSYLRRDRLWIAMEYCGGGSVQDIYHVTNQGLNELQIAFISREMLKGLEYLHERNMIHRDIKGANILLTDDGEVKLADFGIAAQLTQTLMMKRKSFIGTPYWMAPEVAAVERKGGYNQQCDIWAVGITAIEFAETQPPMFDLHPMRALYLMTKRNFRSPTLQHKNKWSENFHDFLRNALQKEPKRRPTATELLKHEFVNRAALCSTLTITLIKVLEAPPPKAKTPVEDDPEEPEGERKSKFKRISSVKNQDRIHRQVSDSDISGGLNLPINDPQPSRNMPQWLANAAQANNCRPRIQKLATAPMNEDGEYFDPESEVTSPKEPLPPPYAPPVPPRQVSRPDEVATTPNNDHAVYGNVDQPPVPPRNRPTQLATVTPQEATPPIPPRASVRGNGRSKQADSGRAYFSKIFNGCPLHLTCAAAWTHPFSKKQYVMLGAEEGLFSLLVTDNPEPVMEQVSSRACHWLRVVETALVWLAGSSRHISMTNLVLLFQSDAQKANAPHSSYGRGKTHTARVPESKGVSQCCVVRNAFSDQRFLVAAVPRGILLMQWYQPQQIFKQVMTFDCQLPSPLPVLDAFIDDQEEYPTVCYGVKEQNDKSLYFETINLNSQSIWHSNHGDSSHDLALLSLQQLEKDTFFIGIGKKAIFVDREGKPKPSKLQASELIFDKPSEKMVYLSNCVLSFHKHGMQGKSLVTQQVTAEVADGTKVFHLLGSHGTIIIETRPLQDTSAPSNIYILVSEDTPPQQ